MNLRIHPEALREFDKAVVWYGKWSQLAPQKLQDEVAAASKRILTDPKSFPLISPGRRRALLLKFPYKIIFECRADTIDIIAIAHAKRKTMYWRQRKMPL